jgi:hypothetical protein
MLCKRPLRTQEVLLVARDLAKGLSVLHNEDLVMHDMDCKTVGIKISYDVSIFAFNDLLDYLYFRYYHCCIIVFICLQLILLSYCISLI